MCSPVSIVLFKHVTGTLSPFLYAISWVAVTLDTALAAKVRSVHITRRDKNVCILKRNVWRVSLLCLLNNTT